MSPLVLLSSLFLLALVSLPAADSPPPPIPQPAHDTKQEPTTLEFQWVAASDRKVLDANDPADFLIKLGKEAGVSVVLTKAAQDHAGLDNSKVFPALSDSRHTLFLAQRSYGLICDEADGVMAFISPSESAARVYSWHEAVQKRLSNPGVADTMATRKRVLFDALLEEGFNRQEALQIVMAQPQPKSDLDYEDEGMKVELRHKREPKAQHPVAREEKPVKRPTSKAARPAKVLEYKNVAIVDIIRNLAKENLINVAISDLVTEMRPLATFRIENKTPREVIEILARAHDLQCDEIDGVLYIKIRNERPVFMESSQHRDYQSLPDAARKVARAKRALFDAMVAAKFTSAEALQLVISQKDPPASSSYPTKSAR